MSSSSSQVSSQVSSLESSREHSTASPQESKVFRWFLPKKSIADVFRERLLAFGADVKKGGTVRIASARTETALLRKQGSEPALLVTLGFEAWARLSSKNSVHSPTLRSDRAWFPTSLEQTFGIDERVSPEGKIEKPLKVEDLEFLIEKFKLLKVKEIAIGFLHADRYPQHEIQAAQFFRENGFKVVASHEIPGASSLPESARWRKTLEAAYAETLIQEDLESLNAVLKENECESNWTIQFWNDRTLSTTLTAASIRGGVETAIAASLPEKYDIGLFFGLEEFLALKRKDKDGVQTLKTSLLPVQPTCQIGTSAWPFPSWTGVDRGYEPGPMLFGKSHQLTILDVLFVRGRLKTELEAFTDRVQEKTAARILEALATLGKDLAEPGRRAVDSKYVAEDLETAAIEHLSMELSAYDVKTKPVYVFGPLAPIFLPLLEKRRPDVKFVFDADASIASAVMTHARGHS